VIIEALGLDAVEASEVLTAWDQDATSFMTEYAKALGVPVPKMRVETEKQP
jgi:hypothetical protein